MLMLILCFEANKYDDNDDIYSSEWWMHRAWRIPCIEEALCIIEMTLSLCTVYATVALHLHHQHASLLHVSTEVYVYTSVWIVSQW